MPAHLHYNRADARWIARHAEHVAAAEELAAILPDHYDVTVTNTGGNCPGVVISDGRPEYDVIVCENPGYDPTAPRSAENMEWCAAPDQDCENVHYGQSAYDALLSLDPGCPAFGDDGSCLYCGDPLPADGSPRPCPAHSDEPCSTTPGPDYQPDPPVWAQH